MVEQAVARRPTGPSTLQRWFPIAVWLPKYNWGSNLTPDLIAAISVAALLIPESMGYSSVAGVPAQVGLYAAPLALVGYALLGGSRVLVYAAAGSVAAVTASIIGTLHPTSQAQTETLVAALAIATGLVFLVGGFVRAGWIANFMSKAVMAGFITGMSIQIIVGQFGHLTGVHERGGDTFKELWYVLSRIGSWNWTATILGLLMLFTIFGIQRYVPLVPAALTAVVVSSIYVAAASPHITLVAKIPKGLPSFKVPTGLPASTWATLLLGACVVALVGFSEGWGSVQTIANKTHDDPSANQEFRGFGLGSVGAGILGGMPVTGSLSKSSAAMTAGAKTQMANIFLAIVVLLTLAVLSPLFQWLPETCLAAVVINAMWGSANPTKVINLKKDDWVDFSLAVLTGMLVLIFNLLPAMIAGIVFSIIYLVYRVSFPGRAELGRDDKTGDYEALTWIEANKSGPGNSNARPVPGVMLYRFDSPLIFSNSDAFKAGAMQMMIDTAAKGPLPKNMIIDFEEVFYTDASGAAALQSVKDYAGRYDVTVSIARLHSDTARILDNAGVLSKFGNDHIYESVHAAIQATNGATSTLATGGSS
jgi:SulP family sulfate permease